jgi:hypothetical protein
MERARGSKLELIGYVTLGYAKRSAAEVKADVDRWMEFYPGITGFFFDEQPSGPEHAAFARDCFAHARSRLPGARIVSNPGVPCDAAYAEGEHPLILCLFEHESGFAKFRIPEWARQRSPELFATLHYHANSAEAMQALVAESLARNAAYVYVTDASGANPWDRLPSYWNEEVAEVAGRNSRP